MKKMILILCLVSSSAFADDFSSLDLKLHGLFELKTNSDHTMVKAGLQTANPAWNSAISVQQENQFYNTNFFGTRNITTTDARAAAEITYTERWLTMGIESSHREISLNKNIGKISNTNNIDFIIRAKF